MKTVNYEQVNTAWQDLCQKYGNKQLCTKKLFEVCKRRGISLGNGMKDAYVEVGALTCPSRGQVVVAPAVNKQMIIRAYERVRKLRKDYRISLERVHAFNLAVESRKNPDLTPEACIEFLRQKGFFVYKPTKGEVITVTKEYKY